MPSSSLRPKCRKFPTAKPRADADNRIMARNIVAADNEQQTASEQRPLRTRGLTCDKQRGQASHARKQAAQRLVREMMQKQIRGHDVSATAAAREKREHIGADRLGLPSELPKSLVRLWGDDILPIHERKRHAWPALCQTPRECQHERAVASPQFHDSPRRSI